MRPGATRVQQRPQQAVDCRRIVESIRIAAREGHARDIFVSKKPEEGQATALYHILVAKDERGSEVSMKAREEPVLG